MIYSLICQNSNTGEVFDVTSLAGDIKYDTQLYGQPGKLSFSLQQDPNGLLQVSSGSIISFSVDNVGVFFGYVFKMGTDATGIYKITAYDQMRYLKNEEVMYTEDKTASDIFSTLCNQVSLSGTVKTPSSSVVPAYYHDKKSLYQIMDYAITWSNVQEQKQYFVRDVFGALTFTELSTEKTNYVIGDKSLLTSYQYEIDIDTNTSNQIKLVRDNKETGKRDVWITKDGNNQKRWGLLQHLEKLDEELNEPQIIELANNLLKLKNRENKTMKITSIGIMGLYAGNGFILNLDKLNISQYMWIVNASHEFRKDIHTMSLEVFL